jgi:hypothetical protein
MNVCGSVRSLNADGSTTVAASARCTGTASIGMARLSRSPVAAPSAAPPSPSREIVTRLPAAAPAVPTCTGEPVSESSIPARAAAPRSRQHVAPCSIATPAQGGSRRRPDEVGSAHAASAAKTSPAPAPPLHARRAPTEIGSSGRSSATPDERRYAVARSVLPIPSRSGKRGSPPSEACAPTVGRLRQRIASMSCLSPKAARTPSATSCQPVDPATSARVGWI